MLNDCNEVLMPRSAPEPAPLIEVSAQHLVPEVSLLLDQDKSRSFQLNNPSVPQCESNKIDTNFPRREESKILHGNRFESYNTWKAKNAQALHTITESLDRVKTTTTNTVGSRSLNDTRRKQTSDNEYFPSRGFEAVTSPPVASELPYEMYRLGHGHKTNIEFHSHQNEISGQRTGYNCDRTDVNYPIKPLPHVPLKNYDNYCETQHNAINPLRNDIYHVPKESHNQVQNTSFPMTMHTLNSNAKDVYIPNMQHNYCGFLETNGRSNRSVPEHISPNFCCGNISQVQCQGQNVVSSTGVDLVRNKSLPFKETRSITPQMLNSKVVSPIDIAQINNQAVIDLYHIIHLQNEQILMLQQQVKQVLQIHLDCERSSLNKQCVCQCKHDGNKTSDIDTCANLGKDKNNSSKSNQLQNKPTLSSPSNGREKRSIGVMTSIMEDNHNRENVDANTQTISNNIPKSKKQPHHHQEYNSPAPCHYKHQIQNKQSHGERRRKPQHAQTLARKSIQEESVYSPVDNSFSFNEAELVIRTEAETDTASPSASVHVDLQDYCSSSLDSNESDTSESISEDEDDTESENKEESSNPQLGWTFYNRVVGQVNNILKKTTSPQQKQTRMPNKPFKNDMLIMNGEYETENDWSKRVTFEGPIMEDTDNNMPNIKYVPKLQKHRRNQEYNENGQPDMTQDFMMYNVANGNTSLSFAKLRYLEHYNLLPSQPGLKTSDYMNQGYQKTKQRKTKKKKPKNSDNYTYTSQKIRKQKSSVPSSKILDMTALKQQPKLF